MNVGANSGAQGEPDSRSIDKSNDTVPLESIAGFEELIQRIKNGDRLALQELLQSSRDYLLLIANQEMDRDLHRKLGPSDIVQNTMLSVCRHVDEFRGSRKEQFMAWVRQILLRDLSRVRREMQGTAKRDMRRERSLEGDSRVGRLPLEVRDADFTPQTRAVRDEEKKTAGTGPGETQRESSADYPPAEFRTVVL